MRDNSIGPAAVVARAKLSARVWLPYSSLTASPRRIMPPRSTVA